MESTHILEINLISAQGLKPSPSNLRRMQTYALAWVEPSTKLRTRVDKVGGENPTWNDKFLFRVTPEFLSSEISGISVEIYAVGYLRDHLIGTVRFLISNLLSGSTEAMKTPSFTALQIRRPSGRFYGVLNIGAMMIDGCSDFAAALDNNVSAIGYRDLMGGSLHRRRRRQECIRKSKSMSEECHGESCENDNSFVEDASDGADSTTSSSSTTSTALKDWNGIRDLEGKNHFRSSSDGGGLLCCLLMQRRIHFSPSDQNLQVSGGSLGNKN